MHNSWLTILKALQGTEYQHPEKKVSTSKHKPASSPKAATNAPELGTTPAFCTHSEIEAEAKIETKSTSHHKPMHNSSSKRKPKRNYSKN
jgi:hypothetical protein